MKTTVLIILMLFVALNSKAQSIENWISQHEKHPVEKIYLHTDKEFYFQNETIWLKAYLTDSRSGRLIPGAENVYIKLLDKQGKTILKTTLMSVNGQVPASIHIPDTIKAGNYLLQAFTDYLMNFGSESFFYKPLSIQRISSSAGSGNQYSQSGKKMVADVNFMPEGGKILENMSNVVAFKAINRDGYGVEAKGSVRDEKGKTVVEFATDYKGMGLFFFTPEPGKSYSASINGFPSFKYSFDSVIVAEGVKIQVVNQTSNDLLVNIAANTDQFKGQRFYLADLHRGEVVFYQAFKMEEKNHVLKFNSENLKGGINTLVLLNNDLVPVSERLIFSENYQVNNMQVVSGSEMYFQRNEATVYLNDSEKDTTDDFSNISVAVVHNDAIKPGGLTSNILSYMLLDSELNGFVESSADYFNDTEMSSRSKLSLLMLTNGWSSYFWNTAPSSTEPLVHKQKVGIDVQGSAINVMNEQPVDSGDITMIIEKDGEMAVLTQKTDRQGHFMFPGLLFKDTASVYIQAKNEKGRMNTNIQMVPVFPAPAPSPGYLTSVDGFYNTPYELQRQKYYSDRAFRNYDPNYRSRRINQVDVIEERLAKGDDHFRIYDKADQVLEIPANGTSQGNILEFMTGKASGVDITVDDIKIRGISGFSDNSMPLFLVDGVPLIAERNINFPAEVGQNAEFESTGSNSNIIEKVKSIPMGDIQKVEILKSPQNLALFGTEGANGVIAIYTRRGRTSNVNPLIKGLLERKIEGYSTYKNFYSPKYTPETKNDEKPDFRTTLFWAPDVTTQNGQKELRFFTSDQTGSYKVIVEGISNKGIICSGSASFEVVDQKEN